MHRPLPVTDGVRRSLRFGGMEMDARPGLAPGISVLRTDGSTTLPCARLPNGVAAGICTRTFWFTARDSDSLSYGHSFFLVWKSDPPVGAAPTWSALRERCIAGLCHGGIENGAPTRIRTSSFRLRRAACISLTPWKLTKRAPCRSCPGALCLEDRRACCYTNDAKVVAASGIAPDSPRLQRGANLSQLHSQNGPSTR